MPALSSAAASRSMSVAGACRTVVRTCSAVVIAMLAPELGAAMGRGPHESRHVAANGLLQAIAPLGPEPQGSEPGRVTQHPAMLRQVGHGAELLLEYALAVQVERHASRPERALHHRPGHQLGWAIPAVTRAVRPHPQMQLRRVDEERARRDAGAVGHADRHGDQAPRLLHVPEALVDAPAAERYGVPAPQVDLTQLVIVLVYERFIFLGPDDEPEPLGAPHVAAGAVLEAAEGALLIVGVEGGAKCRCRLAAEPERAHQGRRQIGRHELDVTHAVHQLEIG